jgi:hypothetical protein
MFSGSPGAVWNIVTRNYMARRRET